MNRHDLDRLALGPPGVPTRISPKNEPHSFRPQDLGKGSSPYGGGKKVGKRRQASRVIVSARPERRAGQSLSSKKTVTPKPRITCPQCGATVTKLSKHLRKAHAAPGLVESPESKPKLEPSKSTPVRCPKCGCSIKENRLRSHLARVHRLVVARELGHPNHTMSHHNRGVAYYNLGRYQDAVEAFKQAIRRKPDYALAHYNLGGVYLSLGDKSSAFKEYKILRTLDQNLANALFRVIQ